MTSFANIIKITALFGSLAAAPALADDIVSGYSHEVLTRISDHAIYPHNALMKSEQGVVTVAVTVDEAGNLKGVNILKSSGVAAIDLAAIQAAKDAAPFPAPTFAVGTVVRGRIRFEM